MSVVRRLYLYGIAAASLLPLSIGLSELLQLLVATVERSAGQAGETVALQGVRSTVIDNAALVVVGLPVWLLHWGLANRGANRDRVERAAALRRLYVYGVLLVAALRWAFSAHQLLLRLGEWLAGGESDPSDPWSALRTLPWIVIATAIWIYHRQVAIADRRQVGELGAAATLRRWYTYGLAFIGWWLLLEGATRLLRYTWSEVAAAVSWPLVDRPTGLITGPVATILVGLILWLAHWSGWAIAPARRPATGAADVAAQDARSVLRLVYLFLGLGLVVAMTLGNAAQLLYFGVARLLGVAEPGGVSEPLVVAMAGPGSHVLIYGLGWLYLRHTLARQALAQPELPRQAGVRRLYTYLVAVISLVLYTVGLGGLLWVVTDALTGAPRTVASRDWWPEQVSLYVTMVATGLPVWLLHWVPVAGPAGRRWTVGESQSLARRLYIYLTLLLGVLVLLASGIEAARQILDLALGVTATASAVSALARAVAVATVAGFTVFYHFRVLRADIAAGGASPAGGEPAAGRPAAEAETAVRPAFPSPAFPHGIVYRRQETEASRWFATEREARDALADVRRHADDLDWAALVRVDGTPADASESKPAQGSGEQSGEGAGVPGGNESATGEPA